MCPHPHGCCKRNYNKVPRTIAVNAWRWQVDHLLSFCCPVYPRRSEDSILHCFWECNSAQHAWQWSVHIIYLWILSSNPRSWNGQVEWSTICNPEQNPDAGVHADHGNPSPSGKGSYQREFSVNLPNSASSGHNSEQTFYGRCGRSVMMQSLTTSSGTRLNCYRLCGFGSLTMVRSNGQQSANTVNLE
uniref:Reverse transcriptase zinc-binding domain-containing protein n=1 Tax=Physcomitrium patens TaxID=3218 RepID=A0A2K1ICC6_PHYPA|nr:uncharacterized protein LOC112277799 isoform X1 [Physcomitrium patens]PNR26935.1 hypothetical protein PHYPA_030416 [Physcomitrium patens]|eukprot:XP_024366297.1 uncharacterized protein LOC112277799 isoform X1 [Physcomitrella patens]